MAETLVLKVLVQLASLASPHIEREWSLVSEIEEKVESLTTKLEDIRVLLEDAEKRQIQEGSVKRWLDKLKAVSYEMDAVLDKWNTANLLRSNIKLSSKVRLYTVPYFNRNKVHRPGLRRRTASKIETLKINFDEIFNDQIRSTFTTNVNPEYVHRGDHTTSEADASEELYGRHTEKTTLISNLTSEVDQARNGHDSESSRVARKGHEHDIIPIVGMGGIGKTSLVRFVYNEVGHFDIKIWVSVSVSFDKTRIARAILEALEHNIAHRLVEFQALLGDIGRLIRGKRFLLVLDNVWIEDNSKWCEIENTLRNGAVGSKILVTTRKEEVAIVMRAEKRMITLKCLSEEDYFLIFKQVAFQNHDDKQEELGEIGKGIAHKCRGLPLVAKVLGSLMQFKKYTKEDWDEVLHSELWKLGNRVKNDVFVPFLLSYNDLSPLEKCCFLYCSYFPKDYPIDRDELIQLWMSQGYLSSSNEDVRKGINCFENFAKRSLFQDFQKDEDGNIIRCKIHDIVHDFILFLANNEYFNALINTKEDERKPPPLKPFHCTLLLGSEACEVPSSIYSKRNLRTLSVGNLGSIRWDLLLKLKHLRTLDLGHCSFSGIPNNIDKLILLRYLNLSHNGQLKKLPKALCNLFNLQTLKVEDCGVKLPKGIKKLVNLKHLYLGKSSAVQCPKELGKLTSLETLDHYIIVPPPKSRKDKRMELEDLKELNHLKGRLRVSGIGWTEDVNQAKTAQLDCKERLVVLHLEFHGGGDKHPSLLEDLQPHSNLKHLEISHYSGTTMFPSWMTSLNNLKRLVLQECSQCESLGPFGRLELLSVQSMKSVKKVGQQFLGIENGSVSSFPSLQRLEFDGLESWDEWESGASSNSYLTIMPRLVSLEIKDCPLLKAPLPEFLRRKPLQNFPIKDCPILEQHFQQGIKVEDLVKTLTSPTL